MLKQKIYTDIKKALEKLKLEFDDNFVVEVPNNIEHGDYSCNIALKYASLNKLKPREMAQKLADEMVKKKQYKKITVEGPGFINFIVSNSVLQHELINIVDAEDNFGASGFGKKKKILIEFISANPTGPLNIVSARAAAYGDTLYRIMKYVGFLPTREFYINDAGNQVDILAESLELRYRELHNEDIGEFPVEAYHGEYIKDLAVALNTVEGTKLLHVAERDRIAKLKEFALKEIHQMQLNSLEQFDVIFDSWVSEKSLRKQGVVEEVLSFLSEAGCTYEQEEAVWFNSSKYGDEKDRVLMKADGSITYFVPDVAYHLTKYQRGFDEMVDVLGPDHHGYVPRLNAAITALGYDRSRLEIVFLQQVNLYSEGERVKMSKRAGKIVTMDDLLEEVGKDAARFFFVNRKPSAHLNFDLDLATTKSSENPVFYCQYAHARICSILKKAHKEKISLQDFDTKLLKKLNKESELKLIKKMLELPELLNGVALSREPHRLADYCIELAGMFHKYYQKYTTVNSRYKELSQCRLYLIQAIKNVLAISLGLMGVSAPEEMKK